MSWDDCVIPEFMSDKRDFAVRKDHKCIECGDIIKKGERAYRYAAKWDGDFSSGYQHMDCCITCEYIRDELDEECIPFGYLGEWVDEELSRFKPKEKRLWPKEVRRTVAKFVRRWRT